MRIAYVTPRYAPLVGGVETHVQHLAEGAAGAGHEVEVLTQAAGHEDAGSERAGALTVRRFAPALPSAHYAAAPGLGRHLLRARGARAYDLVHAHNYHALPALAATLAEGRLVFTPHYHGTSDSPLRRALHRPYRRAGARILRRAGRVICVSAREARLLERDFPWVAERVVVVPNGVDTAAIAAARPFEEQRLVVLSAGRLEHYKNVAATVRAMTALDDRFVLRVTGEGPARDQLQALVLELGLADRVLLLGQVELSELHRWFATAAVYVTMSTIEAMPITPLEVLSAGARMVASDIDAHREVARTTGAGVRLVAADCPPAELAREIARAAADPAAVARVPSWEEVVRQTLELYAALPGRAGPVPRAPAPGLSGVAA